SNFDNEIGKEYTKITEYIKEENYSQSRIKHYLYKSEPMLDVSAPIIFQTTEIGRIHLGISQKPLEHLSQQMLWALAIIAVTTILAVSFATYMLGRQIARPISILNKAMQEIEANHYSYRISTNRHDEFGQLFSNFDNMAAKIQEKDEKNSTNK
ncbi:MAG: HAMP domain-containing protein, partial [Gammaproteobacteria bacterium]|nr:HAMP domain-containing protein [Gammaproteobacteria bacterium]